MQIIITKASIHRSIASAHVFNECNARRVFNLLGYGSTICAPLSISLSLSPSPGLSIFADNRFLPNVFMNFKFWALHQYKHKENENDRRNTKKSMQILWIQIFSFLLRLLPFYRFCLFIMVSIYLDLGNCCRGATNTHISLYIDSYSNETTSMCAYVCTCTANVHWCDYTLMAWRFYFSLFSTSIFCR